MRGWACGSLLLLALASCGPDEDPPPCVTVCCAQGSTRADQCNTCPTGQVQIGSGKCEVAAASCGDTKFQPALEDCDPTAAASPMCGAGKMCMDCACVANPMAVCGDGMVSGAESCERNAECTQSADLVCRRCQCALRGERVTFNDTVNDTLMTPQGYAFESLGLELDGGNEEIVVLGYADIGGAQPDMLSEACFVVVVAEGQEQRLCIEKSPGVGRETTFTDVGGAKMNITAQAPPNMLAGTGFLIRVPATLGVRFEAALSFYAESRYAGTRTDVLPDTGTISFREIFGE